MTPEEEKVWAYLVKDPTAPATKVAYELGVPVALAQSCIDRIGTPRDVLAAKAAYGAAAGTVPKLPDPEAVPLRAQLLKEAIALTTGDRNKDYGDPYDNLFASAQILQAMSGIALSASDIARVMIATKFARMKTSPLKRDHFVDIMAYTGILYECLLEELGDQE